MIGLFYHNVNIKQSIEFLKYIHFFLLRNINEQNV